MWSRPAIKQVGMSKNTRTAMCLGSCALFGASSSPSSYREQIDALTDGLRLNDFEAAGIAKFPRDAVRFAAQAPRDSCPRAGQQFPPAPRGRLSPPGPAGRRRSPVLALVTRQQRLHQGEIYGLDEPGVHELLQISRPRRIPFPAKPSVLDYRLSCESSTCAGSAGTLSDIDE